MRRPSSVRYRLALTGLWPAEALDADERRWLVSVLHGRGWTDSEMAVHTLWTEYTVARIRGGMGLAPNKQTSREGRSA